MHLKKYVNCCFHTTVSFCCVYFVTERKVHNIYLHIHPNTAQQLQVCSDGFEALCCLQLNCIRRTELQSCATAPHWSIRSIAGSYIRSYEMNEWMMHLYSALLCIVVHPKRFTIMWGGSFLNHHQCAASIWMMRRLPQDNGTSALTTHQLQVERRER